MRSFYFTVISLLIFISCQYSSSKLNNEIKVLKSKPILIDYPLKYYSITKGWYNYSPRKKYEIITYIDSRCSTCLNELGLWNEFIENNRDLNVDYLIFLKVDDFNNVDFFLRHIDFKFPIIVDQNDVFFNQNKLPKDKTLHTFLVDSTKNIILVGNPTLIPSLNKLFRDYVKI